MAGFTHSLYDVCRKNGVTITLGESHEVFRFPDAGLIPEFLEGCHNTKYFSDAIPKQFRREIDISGLTVSFHY